MINNVVWKNLQGQDANVNVWGHRYIYNYQGKVFQILNRGWKRFDFSYFFGELRKHIYTFGLDVENVYTVKKSYRKAALRTADDANQSFMHGELF